MPINLGDLNKKKKEEEEYVDVGGLKVSKDAYENTATRLRQQTDQKYEDFKKQRDYENDIMNASFFTRAVNTGADLLTDISEGFLNRIEGIVDYGTYRVADIGDLFGATDFANALKQNADFESTKALFGKNENVQENLLSKGWLDPIEKYSVLDDTADTIAQGIGGIGALASLGLVTGGGTAASVIGSYTSAYGNARSEAKRNGASDRDANRAGIINGFAEALSEQFFEGMPGLKVEGWGSKLTGKFADKVAGYFGSTAGKIALKSFDAMGEGAEEIISNSLVAVGNDLMQNFVDKNYTYGMENQSGNILEDALASWTDEESWSAFFSAAMTSAILGTGKAVLDTRTQNKIINAYAKDNSMSFKDAKYILTGQMESAKQELQRDEAEFNSNVELEDLAKKRILNFMKAETGQNVEAQIEQRIQEQEQDLGTKFNEEQREKMKTEIRTMYEDRINSQNRYQDFTLENEPTDEREKELYKSFRDNNRNNTKETHEIYNLMKTLQDNNKTSKYRLTSNEELAKMGELERVEQDGKVKYTKNGQEVAINGFKKGDTIYINADAVNPYQATIGHEIGEAIKASDKQAYDSLKQLVKQVYGEGNLDDYKQLYGENLTDDVEDEYVNDKLGEMFKDNKLIDRIGNNKNLLQRFIDEVKRLVKYATSSKEQKQLQKLQKTLEDKYIELYKEADFSKGNESASFSLDTDTDTSYQSSQYDKAWGRNITADKFMTDDRKIYDNLKTQTEALEQLERVKGNPNAEITIYRATPSESINTGDWVFLDKASAERLTKSMFSNIPKPGYRVVEEKVKAKDVDWTGKNLEFVYSPEGKRSVSYSLSQDSQGRELSTQQQEYFKDSKVRDENGNLQVMYHGTPTGDFTIFHPGSYFSSNKKYAQGYENTWASSISSGKEATNPRTYEVYLNITNPFSLHDSKAKKIYLNEYIKGGNSLYYDPYTDYTNVINDMDEIDWTEGEDLKEWLQENHPEYDGLVLDEGGDGGYGEAEYRWRGKSFVPFNSNQIKNVDNLNPTTNDDIRYQLSNKAEQSGFEETEQIKDYSDYIESLNTPATDRFGILTKEDYTKKKKELYEQYVDRTAKKIDEQVKEAARRNLALKKGDIEALKAITDKYSNLSREDIYASNAKEELRQFVKDHSHQEYEEQIINDEIRAIQKDIRSREFIISNDYKGDFPDGLTRFKKNNPGINIKFGQKGNLDTQLQELAELYPGQINDDVNYGDIPFVLADIMKQQYKQGNLQEFNLTDNEIDNITNKLFFGLTNNAISEQDLDKFVSQIQDKIRNKYARQMAIKEYRELAKEMIGDISQIKDKKRGLLYQINTMKRNLRDIMNKEQAQKMYDVYFKPISIHNAQIETDISEYNDRISKYNLTDEESVYTQMLGELKYNPKAKLSQQVVDDYLQKHRNKINTTKVNSAIEEFRQIYDELIVKVNESLEANGYKPVDYHKGYFPHFVEDKASSVLGKFAERLGFEVKKGDLPTDIAGISDEFQPGKAWTSFSQQRTGEDTDYNALKGMDNYLRGAMDVIYHTQDIQKLRALEAEIRYQYTEKGVQEKLDEIFNNQDLSNDEKYAQAALIVDNQKNNPLGNFATELRNYTNSLANKKSIGDRGMEQTLGRDMYSIMNNISGRVSANMVGANISSAMTNFIPITQAWSQVKTKNMLKGIYSTIKASIRDDGFSNNSIYLTNRTKKADTLYKKKLDKINQKLGIPFEAVDSFTSNVIVRAKYFENLDKGMSERQAIDNADEFAKDVMAGRSKGDAPTMFNKKNPLAKLFTAFQLEVNNQYGYMFKDIKADIGKEAKAKLAAAFMKMFLGAWLYNMISEKITGRKSAFSPIDMAIDESKIITNDNLNLATKIQNIAKDVAEESPFLGGIMGGGRLPIQGAIPYSDPLSMVLSTGENVGALFDDEKRDKAINSLKKEWLKPVYYVALPFAGGQIKKTNEGLAMYNHELPGSYTDSGRLRFEADTSALGRLQAAVFGQYASENAREYFDEGYSPLTEKQLAEAMDTNLPISEYRQIKKGLSEAVSKAKEDDTSQSQAKADYIYNLPLSDEQKNVLVNNALNRKKEVDITSYGDYGSLEEFDYANKEPQRYATITQITDYNSYQLYKEDISALKKEYDNKEDRQKAVFEYINKLPLNQYQKLMLQKMAGGYSIKNYEKELFNYINGLDLTKEEKENIHKELFK